MASLDALLNTQVHFLSKLFKQMLVLKVSILDSNILDPTNYATPRIGLIGTACRSSMTKLVSPRDIGKQALYKLKQG